MSTTAKGPSGAVPPVDNYVPVGVSVRPVVLSKTFRDARERDAAAIRSLRAGAR